SNAKNNPPMIMRGENLVGNLKERVVVVVVLVAVVTELCVGTLILGDSCKGFGLGCEVGMFSVMFCNNIRKRPKSWL
ncbi:MAG: hypothetical protein SGJ02_00455, partial [bacterium]|nr:hypothetical protein [bacterium]